ncbi:MAG TPA: HlyD family efflux transporter periplasmic adaptor subunit [Patescibacteria group bacterium]|nr:HlyD family efflux transporter periplasmic adaptor subunit [Patescibacteria group bacterium]
MKNLLQKIKNPKVFKPLLIVTMIVVVVVSYIFYQIRSARVFIDDSLVQAPLVIVSPSTSGTLTALTVYEGEYVNKGDSLAIAGGQTIYADSDGLVVMANNQIGSSVGQQTPVVELVNPEDMRIAGTIDENKGLSSLHIGQVVSFTIDALPGQTFWGYIDEVSPTAKQSQVAFSISSERPTQQFVVYAKFDAKKYPAIKNGMSAKMTIFTGTK